MAVLSPTSKLPRLIGFGALITGSAFAGALLGPHWLTPEPATPLAVSSGAMTRPDDPVALVAGQPITGAELEIALEKQLEPVRRRLAQNLADERKKIVDRVLRDLVEDRLLAAEARSRGITTEQLLEQETGITSKDVDAYLEKKPITGSLTREQIEPRLRNYLAGDKRTALLSELRQRHGAKILLEPERQAVKAGNAPALGPATAPVELVLFSDFQCPYCARMAPIVHQVEQRYGARVRIAFRQFPLTSIHPQAYGAATATLCADEQGKFWELHDALFADQKALAPERIADTAGRLGVDRDRFAACLESGRSKRRVDEDLAAGRALGLTGTPAAFVNGRLLTGAQPFETFAALIDDELARASGS